MKAVVYDRYGSPDVLRLEDVPVPSPGEGQVRVKIAAASVNLSDWECLRGSPAYARIGGLRFPACRTLGSDIAGVVDAVGTAVTRCVGGAVPTLLRVLTVGSILGRLTHRRIGVLAVKEGPAHFEPLATLCLAGEVRIHVDRTFTLDEVPAALAHVGEGRAVGKVVIEVS